MNGKTNESQKSTAAARKSRALRPALESCEAREMLSVTVPGTAAVSSAAVAPSKLIEPLQFSAAIGSYQYNAPSDLTGTLRLVQGSNGALSGQLTRSDGRVLPLTGTLVNQRITLTIPTESGYVVRATGPVVSARTPSGQITLHGGGLIVERNNVTVGNFTIEGSNVVLPQGRLPNPATATRLVAPGTTLVPTNFVGQVTRGPDAGTMLTGSLSLGTVGRNGTFAGTLADPNNGVIPVSGQVVGSQLSLSFDLGAGGTVGGTGPMIVERITPGQVRLTSFGSLQTGNPADSGDWALTNSPLNNTNQSGKTNYVLNQNNVFMTGTKFVGTSFATSVLTNSVVDRSVTFSGAVFGDPTLVLAGKAKGANLNGTKFIGVNFSGAKLPLAKMIGTDLSQANFTGAYLAYADLSGAKLINAVGLVGINLTGAWFIGADLTGTGLTTDILDSYRCHYDATTIGL